MSTCDVKGGASRAAHRLHTGLLGAGLDSSMYVRSKLSRENAVVRFSPSSGFRNRVARGLRNRRIKRNLLKYRATRPDNCELFSDDRSSCGADMAAQLPEADLINLHWVAGFVDYEAFFGAVGGRMPLVWRLADMNAFTGGCHYDQACGRFRESCGNCPQLGSTDADDLSHQVWARKRRAFDALSAEDLHIVGPSRWTARCASESSLLSRFPNSVIPNGLDVEQFVPRPKQLARQAVGIPPGAKAVLFVADWLRNARKGLTSLVAALEGFDDDEVFLMSVGRDCPTVPTNLQHRHLGYVDNDWLLSMIYSAADVFVIPSLQESFGQTVTEALACGTPVVGFDVGGIPDMVRPGETGYLATVGDPDDLARCMRQALADDEALRAMSQRCREVAVAEYDYRVQARRYAALYRELIEGRSRRNSAHDGGASP